LFKSQIAVQNNEENTSLLPPNPSLLTSNFGLSTLDFGLLNEALQFVEINTKYSSYIEKEQEMAEKISKNDDLYLREDFDYFSLKSLSYEAREKLSKIKPATIGQASRISGVSPADIAVLLIYLRKL
jgi:tRNA uridine 5-carboxymethylaminomethyl modification enzyme